MVMVNAGHQLKILGLFPHPGVSHFHFFHPIMRGLADVGHDVTVVSHFPDKSPPIRYKDLPLTGLQTLQNTVDVKMFEKPSAFVSIQEFFLLNEWGREACNITLRSDALTQVLKQRKQYDVVIMEMFNTDCMMGVAHVLKAPVIGLSSCAMMPWHFERMGTPVIPSYIPSLFLGKSENMNFWERLNNWISFHSMNFLYQLYSISIADKLIQYKFGHDIPSVGELVKDTSAFFVNQHFSLSGAKPLPPNVIELGGIHIQKAKPLDLHIQRFLDNAEHGVIVISWGSMIRSESLPASKRDGLLRAIKRLKQKVIWKWENDTLENKPENLLASKWLPQRDILCHPNVKVFMTHAGLMGSSEAAYCGVPVVATPFYGDQFLNAAALESRGMAVRLDFKDITENSVIKAIKKALEKQMMDNAKAVSHSYNHRPQTALQTAIWWVEYVAKTEGAPLAKTPARKLSRFVYYSLDVYSLLTVTLLISISSWVFIIRKLCKRRPHNVKDQNKKTK